MEKQTKIKAVIFDMTGVLCDPTPFIWKARETILRTYGIKLTNKEIQEILGKSLKEQIKIINKKYKVKIEYDIFSKETATTANQLMKGKLKANKGVKKLIKKLKNKNTKIALASQNTKNNILFYLKEIGISEKDFDSITTVEELNKFKPNPQIFEITCKKLKINPEEILVIDDSVFGLKAAEKIKMKSVGFASNFQKKENIRKHSKVIDSLEEIKELLK
jgi:HAD superfamily hydrolase (TIGR01509 family)